MIHYLANLFTSNLLGLEGTKLGESLNFFIYDTIKIALLLLAINYLMAAIRHFLPTEKIRDFLSSHKLYGFDHLLAALFGSITPFCSCSSIPLFVGFVRAGIPLGVVFSFLITSPIINEAALAVFIGIWGLKITLIYAGLGIAIGVLGGLFLRLFNLEPYIEDFVTKKTEQNASAKTTQAKLKTRQLLKKFYLEALDISKKIIPYVIAGVALGAVIHGYVPENFFAGYIKENNPFAVPIAVVLAVPLYANAVGVIPVVQSLFAKGIPLGTSLAFMMATVGLSLPEALILKKVIKPKLLLFFYAIVTVAIIAVGYLFNLLF